MKVKIFLATVLLGISGISSAHAQTSVYTAPPASPAGSSQSSSNVNSSSNSTNIAGSNSQNVAVVPNTTASTAGSNNQNIMNMPIALMPDGVLLRKDGGMTVYLVHGAVLHPFTSSAVFVSNGFKFADVIVLPASAFDQAKFGENVLIPEGTLLKGQNDPTVFFIHDNKRWGVPSMQMFTERGFSFNKVFVVPDSELQSIALGGVLQ